MDNLPSILSPDLGLLFWMLLAFAIVFFVVGKYGFPVIVKMVEDRKRYIDESLSAARQANAKLANIQAEGDALLREARERQAEILKGAMQTRDNILSEAKEKADIEGAKLLLAAKEQINAERENALREIRATVAELSVGIAEKVMLRELQSDKEQEKFIQRLLDEAIAG